MKAIDYILRKKRILLLIITFFTLSLAFVNISLPKIKEYNLAVHEEQIKLETEANGNTGNAKASFGIYSFNRSPNFSGIFTFALVALFLSLAFTKRIVLSFIFLFLLFVQITIFLIANVFLKVNHYLGNPFYFQLLLLFCLVGFSFWLAFVICRFAHQRFQAKIFLK